MLLPESPYHHVLHSLNTKTQSLIPLFSSQKIWSQLWTQIHNSYYSIPILNSFLKDTSIVNTTTITLCYHNLKSRLYFNETLNLNSQNSNNNFIFQNSKFSILTIFHNSKFLFLTISFFCSIQIRKWRRLFFSQNSQVIISKVFISFIFMFMGIRWMIL